jgi:hypothetical protein
VCDNRISNSVPKGRLNLAQDASPGLDVKGRPVPKGRLKMCRDVQSWIIFSRPYGTQSGFMIYPGLTSWAKFNRPFGTECRFPLSRRVVGSKTDLFRIAGLSFRPRP